MLDNPKNARKSASGGQRASRLVRRGPSDHLRDAVIALTGGHAIMLRHREKPWASITFEGSRHRFDFRLYGAAAVAAGEEFVFSLSDHEFSVPGHIAASAEIMALDHRLVPYPEMRVTAEILLLKDA